jgi:oligoribonuclease NrnB/cAMP/cGMP phosphodiesterase (DHH superfamily)
MPHVRKSPTIHVHVIHHNDLDGICAAAIVKKFYDMMENPRRKMPKIVFYETNYNRPSPIKDMTRGDLVWIVDFSYPPGEMENISRAIELCDGDRRVTEQITWIDHHQTAAAYGYDHLPGLRDFTDKGPSGCELTWNYCFPTIETPEAVRLIGDYDSWRLQIPASKIFYEGAKIELLNPHAALWDTLLEDNEEIAKIISDWGRKVTAYRDNYTAMIRKAYGYEAFIPDAPGTLDGYGAYAMNLYGFGSGQFGDLFEKYPVVIAYVSDGHKFTVSLYSVAIDVGKIAKAYYGGGGHTGAAGFICRELPFKPQEVYKNETCLSNPLRRQ